VKDAHGVLHDLLVGLRRVVTEWLNDRAHIQILEGLATLLVNAQVANRE
jgi:hypothetical protein